MEDNSINLQEENIFSLKEFMKFIGPGILISIGYLDPGNC